MELDTEHTGTKIANFELEIVLRTRRPGTNQNVAWFDVKMTPFIRLVSRYSKDIQIDNLQLVRRLVCIFQVA